MRIDVQQQKPIKESKHNSASNVSVPTGALPFDTSNREPLFDKGMPSSDNSNDTLTDESTLMQSAMVRMKEAMIPLPICYYSLTCPFKWNNNTPTLIPGGGLSPGRYNWK